MEWPGMNIPVGKVLIHMMDNLEETFAVTDLTIDGKLRSDTLNYMHSEAFSRMDCIVKMRSRNTI